MHQGRHLMKLLLVLIILAIPVLAESSSVEFPDFKPLTQEELNKCESLSYSDRWQSDTLLAVRYELLNGDKDDSIKAHISYIRWVVSSLPAELQITKQKLTSYLEVPGHGSYHPYRIYNNFNFNLWLLFKLYHLPQSREIKRAIQYTKWILDNHPKKETAPPLNLSSPESIATFLGDRVVDRFLWETTSGKFQIYGWFFIYEIEKQFLREATKVAPDNLYYRVLSLFYSSIPNGDGAKSNRSYTRNNLFNHLKSMSPENRSKALLFKDKPEFQSPFWLWIMGYMQYLNGNSFEAFTTMNSSIDSTVLTLPLIYSRTFGKLLETHGTEKDMLSFARMSSVEHYCTPRGGVDPQDYLYPIAKKHGDRLIIAQCNAENDNQFARAKKRRNERVEPLIMIQGKYTTLTGMSGALFWGWDIRGADWLPTMKFSGGHRGATAGAGIISSGGGVMPGYLSATVGYIRSYGESSFHEKYEYEAGRNGVICNAEFGVMLGAVEFGVAAFPKMEDPIHFNFGVSFWFPLTGM